MLIKTAGFGVLVSEANEWIVCGQNVVRLQ